MDEFFKEIELEWNNWSICQWCSNHFLLELDNELVCSPKHSTLKGLEKFAKHHMI